MDESAGRDAAGEQPESFGEQELYVWCAWGVLAAIASEMGSKDWQEAFGVFC
jgi:hypothetical protein